MGNVIEVLHADDGRHFLRIRDLFCRHVAEADMADQSPRFELQQGSERGLQRAFHRAVRAEHTAQVHHLQHVEPQVTQIILDGLGQFGRRHGRQPVALLVAAGANLGDNTQVVRIGMERFADQLIGHMRTVKIRGIDMVYPGLDGSLQDAHRLLGIFRRAEDAGAGQLHRAITQPINLAIAERAATG